MPRPQRSRGDLPPPIMLTRWTSSEGAAPWPPAPAGPRDGAGSGTQPVLLPCSKVLSPLRHHEQNQRGRAAGQSRLPLGQDSPPAVPDPAAGGAAAHDQGAREGHRGRAGCGPPQGAGPTPHPLPARTRPGRGTAAFPAPERRGPRMTQEQGQSLLAWGPCAVRAALRPDLGIVRHLVLNLLREFRTLCQRGQCGWASRRRGAAAWPVLPSHSEPQFPKPSAETHSSFPGLSAIPSWLHFLLHPAWGTRPPVSSFSGSLDRPDSRSACRPGPQPHPGPPGVCTREQRSLAAAGGGRFPPSSSIPHSAAKRTPPNSHPFPLLPPRHWGPASTHPSQLGEGQRALNAVCP